MANENPPTKNTAWSCIIALEDYANPGMFKSNPTIAAGDFTLSRDDAAFSTDYITVSVDPAATVSVQVELTADGMNADTVAIYGHDQTVPPEWCDFFLCILTTA